MRATSAHHFAEAFCIGNFVRIIQATVGLGSAKDAERLLAHHDFERRRQTLKIAATIARYLLGLVFLVIGANKIVPFMPSGPMPGGAAGQFMGALISTKYIVFVGVCEIAGGLLLLINRFVPLALTILGPVIVNILLTGILMTHMALGSGIVVAILWFLVFWQHRAAFEGILHHHQLPK
jgi:putative oxidoreductase